jgi:signal transduction histidine kinase
MPFDTGFIRGLQEFFLNSWQLFLLAVGLLYFFVLMAAARRIGQQAAMDRIQRWMSLPAALLRFFDAVTVDAAVIGLMDSLSEILDTAGCVAALRKSESNRSDCYYGRILAAEGSFRSAADRNLEQMLTGTEWAWLGVSPSGVIELVQIGPGEQAERLRRSCPGFSGGALLVVRLKFYYVSQVGRCDGALIVFDLGSTSLDPIAEEIMLSALHDFPRVLEDVTNRFAHAQEVAELLERSRQKDRILKEMLSGFQHDLSHALSNLEDGMASAREAVEHLRIPADAQDPSILFDHLLSALRLTAHVAEAGTVPVEMAQGYSPLTAVEPYNPEELFRECIQPLLHLRHNARSGLVVHVEIEPGLPAIKVDRVAFFRAVSNIIHNAYKFTEEGGINILIRQMPGSVSFSFSDTGIGIPPDDQVRLGESHFRGSNTEGIPGTGLGLWTARQLVELMGGRLDISSREGVGTTMTLNFPVDPDPVLVERVGEFPGMEPESGR